jgi:hypothetical protein
MSKTTLVYKGDAAYSRSSYLTLEGDTVEFDCSGEEYGPIRFPLQLLLDAIKTHTADEMSDWDVTLMDGLDS